MGNPPAVLGPRITIVTPSFNQAAFLEETVRSIRAQGYGNLEHFVVDGGSTDGSAALIERLSDGIDWWVSESDRGQCHAINKGIARATGDIVAYLNSDDTYLPGAFDAAIAAISAPGVQWVAGGVLGFGSDGSACAPVHEWHMAQPPRSLAECLGGNFIAAQPGHFWRKSLFDRHGLFDDSFRYLFDIEWYARLLAAGERCAVIPRPVASYRFHATSKTVSEGDKFEREWERIRAQYLPRVPWLDQPRVRHLVAMRRATVRYGAALAAASREGTPAGWREFRSAVAGYPPSLATRVALGAARRLITGVRA
ncbi:glycosyltransferase [bacterium]|jgi:glycosyltransferase involved in cell wall biosynthesis|nr:glycosyltransferase [bacterium]